MKCMHCGTENVVQASYCTHCGKAFTEEEKKKAFDQTFWGKLQKLQEVKSILDLSFITDHWLFRTIFLIGLLAAGLLLSNNQGSQMKLLESPDYRLAYNETEKEFYLFSDLDEVVLQLYLPGKPEGVKVSSLDETGKVLETRDYSIDEAPVLKTDSPYCQISGVYEDREDSLRLRLYGSELWPE